MLRVASALSLAACLGASLAACTTDSSSEQGGFASFRGYGGQGYANSVDPRSLANPVMPRAYATLPPAAGPVVNVLEQRFANGLTQDIILAGDTSTGGENKITVSLLSRQANSFDGTNPGMLRLRKSSDAEIFEEISGQFPDVDMKLSQIVDRNAQGPFGYAFGHRGKLTCIFAWQWLEEQGGREGFFFDLSVSDNPSATLRVRLCKTGMSEQTLAGLVRQLVLSQAGGYGGGYAGGGGDYNPYQAGGYASGDALTLAGHGGPVGVQRYQRQASAQGYNQRAALYNSPTQYQGVSAQADPAYRIEHAAYHPKARRKHRVHARRHYRAPPDPLYQGQTAGIPMPGASYAPAPAAQPPRYVPVGQAAGAAVGGYGAVPLPE